MNDNITYIKNLLTNTLSLQQLEIIDESYKHRSHSPHPDGVTHIYIQIQSEDLHHLNRVEQHRKLYTILDPAIKNGLHSVRFKIF